jgi:hypothetical protein
MEECHNKTLYQDIRSQLKTGDIIFFKGGEFVSRTISRVQSAVIGHARAGEYTHVGMVLMSNIFPIGHPYRHWSHELQMDYSIEPYIFESTQSGPLGDGAPNIEGKSFLGTQLRRLDDVVYKYDALAKTSLAWGKLKEEFALTKDQEDKLVLAFNKYVGIPYPISMLEIFSTPYPRLRRLRNSCLCKCFFSKRRMLCSELVAKLFIECGLFDSSLVHPDNAMPCDFIPAATGNRTLDADNEIPMIIEYPIPFTTKQPLKTKPLCIPNFHISQV